jgi:hypothetical protein
MADFIKKRQAKANKDQALALEYESPESTDSSATRQLVRDHMRQTRLDNSASVKKKKEAKRKSRASKSKDKDEERDQRKFTITSVDQEEEGSAPVDKPQLTPDALVSTNTNNRNL